MTTSCGGASSEPAATVCPALIAYTAADQRTAADELDKLPKGDVLRRMIADYGALRDAVRICQRNMK